MRPDQTSPAPGAGRVLDAARLLGVGGASPYVGGVRGRGPIRARTVVSPHVAPRTTAIFQIGG